MAPASLPGFPPVILSAIPPRCGGQLENPAGSSSGILSIYPFFAPVV
jgi:hypothetical protein